MAYHSHDICIMLSYFNLRKGVEFILEGEPYEVLEFNQMKKAQREGIAQIKIKNLITGKVFERNFHEGENFEEAEIEKIEVKFLYSHRGKFIFCESKQGSTSLRFELTEEQIGESVRFFKPNQILAGFVFKGRVINVSLPIKIELKVKEAPPGIKGDRAQGGTKIVTLETGAKINTPLFIEEGDMIEVNTESGQYTRRLEKR